MLITLASGGTTYVMPSDSSMRHAQLLGDDWVELRFETPYYINIEPGSNVEFGGRTYWVERPQDVKIINRHNFEYIVRFDSSAARLKYLPYINPDDGRVTFAVTGNANVHLALLVRAANGISAQVWTAGNTVYDGKEVTVSYDSMSLWEALSLIADSFGTEYEVDGTAIYLRKVEHNKSAPLVLSYGYENGLKSGIQRSNNGDFPPVMALAVKGGNRNINTSSNQSAYGAKTLHMPGPGIVHGIPNIIGFDGEKFAYMDGYSAQGGYHYDKETGFDDTAAKYYETSGDGRMLYYAGADAQNPTMPSLSAGTNVEIIDLSHIYPQREHTVTAVTSQQRTAQAQDGTTETYLEYTVEFATDIDYHAAMIPGSSSLTVIFQSGQLAGREFDANFVQPWQTGNAGKFVIISKFIDDERMPGGTFIPAAGDRFRVFNCMLPQQYIRDDSNFSGAEWDMAREAVRHMWAYGGSSYRWDADLSTVFAAGMTEAQFAKVRVGGYVSFSDPDVQPQQLLIRISEIRQPLNYERRAEIVLEEYSRLRYRRRGVAMKNSVQRLEAERVEGVVQTGAYNNTHSPNYEDLDSATDECVKEITFDGTIYSPVQGVATLPHLKTVAGQSVVGTGDIKAFTLPTTELRFKTTRYGRGIADTKPIGTSLVSRNGEYGEPESSGNHLVQGKTYYDDTLIKLRLISDFRWAKDNIIDNTGCDIYAILQRYNRGHWSTYMKSAHLIKDEEPEVYDKNIYRNILSPVNMHGLTVEDAPKQEGAEAAVVFELPYTVRDIMMANITFDPVTPESAIPQADYSCIADIFIAGSGKSGKHGCIAHFGGDAIEFGCDLVGIRRFSHLFRIAIVRMPGYDGVLPARITETSNYNMFFAGFRLGSGVTCDASSDKKRMMIT